MSIDGMPINISNGNIDTSAINKQIDGINGELKGLTDSNETPSIFINADEIAKEPTKTDDQALIKKKYQRQIGLNNILTMLNSMIESNMRRKNNLSGSKGSSGIYGSSIYKSAYNLNLSNPDQTDKTDNTDKTNKKDKTDKTEDKDAKEKKVKEEKDKVEE